MILKFTDDLLTGVDKIDVKHKNLFVLFEELTISLKMHDIITTVMCVKNIRKDLIEHFTEEENLMKFIKINWTSHIEQHHMFIATVDKLSKEINSKTFVMEILMEMFKYLKNHINEHDKRLTKALITYGIKP